MNVFGTVLFQVIVMLLLIGAGYLCFKIGLCDAKGQKQMTSVLLYLVTPAVILVSYDIPYRPELAQNLAIAFLLAVVNHLLAMGVGYLCIRKKGNEDRAPVERFAVIYSNCGFMALPLVNALYGSEGVFYASAYIIIFQLLSWTHGYAMMAGKLTGEAWRKVLLSPAILAVGVGMVLFVTPLTLPDVVSEALGHLSSLNTPLAMLILGFGLGQTNLLKVLKTGRLYYVSALSLLAVPLLVTLCYLFLPLPPMVVAVNLVAAACPCATVTLLFATLLNRDEGHAAGILAICNLGCVLTIPLVLTLSEFLIQLVK